MGQIWVNLGNIDKARVNLNDSDDKNDDDDKTMNDVRNSDAERSETNKEDGETRATDSWLLKTDGNVKTSHLINPGEFIRQSQKE